MDSTLALIVLITLGILVALSAFFALSETSYSSMNRIRVKNYAKEGNKKAEKALRISEDYDRLLTTILIGNNFVNVAAATISMMLFVGFIMEGSDEGIVAAVSTVATTFVLLTFGEVIPKCIAKERAERMAMALAGPLSALIVVFYPMSVLFVGLKELLTRSTEESEAPPLTEEELIVMIDEIEEKGTIDKHESDLIKSAIEFDEITVGEMYTPRVDVTAISVDTDKDKIKEIFKDTGFSRIPVYNGTIDHIVGVIHSKDFYNHYFESKRAKIDDIMRPIKFVPTAMKISALLKDLQKSKMHMAVVIDPHGGTVGIVTMEDIMEELVGEIWDEDDEIVYAVAKNPDGSYLALGGANIYDVMEETGIKLDLEDYGGHTVGGFVLHKLGKIPANGDSIDMGNANITVKTVKNRRVREVTIIKTENEAEPGDAESE